MAETKLIRDHHLLTRNLKLNDNYISNDGGDEGILIQDDGDMVLTSSGTATLFLKDAGGEYISGDGTNLTIASGNNVTFAAGGVYSMTGGDGGIPITLGGTAKTSSSTFDHTVLITETLDLGSGEAGGSDVHYGLRYYQLQTDISGWNNVYMFYLQGNDGGGGNILSVNDRALLDITTTGTAKSVTDVITITNDVNAADMDGTGSAIKFNQWYYDGSSPAIEDAAKIAVVTETDWTATASTRDSFMAFYTSLDGALAEKLRITSGGDVCVASGGNVGIGILDPDSLLEIFGESAQLKLSWDDNNYAAITVADDGHLELATTGTDADLTLDSASAIMLEASHIYLYGSASSSSSFHFLSGSGNDPKLTIHSDDDGGDQLAIEVFEHGATTISTVDDDGAAAHLNIEVDGHVEFDGCGVGFDKETTTFAASAVLSEGDDSTDIDFRLGNKHELTLTDDIAGSGTGEYINMIFPATSGNFILVLIQGVADCTVANSGWRAYASDVSLCDNLAGSDGADGRVRWAGGSAPTLSTSQYDIDIISIYWDADNQTAFAVASLEF